LTTKVSSIYKHLDPKEPEKTPGPAAYHHRSSISNSSKFSESRYKSTATPSIRLMSSRNLLSKDKSVKIGPGSYRVEAIVNGFSNIRGSVEFPRALKREKSPISEAPGPG
jgi:hypothetical protein